MCDLNKIGLRKLIYKHSFDVDKEALISSNLKKLLLLSKESFSLSMSKNSNFHTGTMAIKDFDVLQTLCLKWS